MKVFSDMPGMLQHVIHRYHRNTMHNYMAEAGLADIGSPILLLTLHEWCTVRNREPSQRELAETLFITPATVAMSLKSLEQGGYIEKRTDLIDQRCKRVAITQKGAETAQKCIQLFEKVEATMRIGMTPEECQHLEDYYLHMVNNLRLSEGEPPLSQERTK